MKVWIVKKEYGEYSYCRVSVDSAWSTKEAAERRVAEVFSVFREYDPWSAVVVEATIDGGECIDG